MPAVPLVEVHRGPFLESLHLGHAVVADADGAVAAWGDPEAVILPRSSCKMLQALPLVESGAAGRAGLGSTHLALACASHQGAAMHARSVLAWLDALDLTEDALRCGTQTPADREEREALIRAGADPGQRHNNCSGKHTGFLTLTRDLGAGPDYVDPDHPVQRAVRATFEEVTGRESPGHGIDGCSAPNFATTIAGLALAMARFATAGDGDARGRAMVTLREAMAAHPDLVAGEGRADTVLMRAMGAGALKSGAEGVFCAILPQRGLGVALKIADGADRAARVAVASLLVRLGVLDARHPAAVAETFGPLRNRAGIEVGHLAAAPGFAGGPL